MSRNVVETESNSESSSDATSDIVADAPVASLPSEPRTGRSRGARLATTIVLWVGFFAAWEIVARIYRHNSPQSADSRLPIPSKVASTLWEKHSLYIDALGVTAKGALLGLLVGVTIGVVIACLSAASGIVESVIYPYLVASQMIPTIILAPIILAVVQDGDTARIIAAGYISFFVVALNLTKGLKSVEPDQVVLLRSINARPWQIYTKLRLPSALPYFFVGLKVAAPLSVVGEVTIELTGAQAGLGTLTLTSLKYGNSEIYTFWGAVFLIGVLGYGLFLIASLIERVADAVAARVQEPGMTAIVSAEPEPQSELRIATSAAERRRAWGRLAMRIIAPIAAFVIFVALWQNGVFHRMFDLQEYTVPYPKTIAELIRDDWSELWDAMQITLRESIIGYAIGNFAGLAIAVAVTATGVGRRVLPGIAGALNSVPIVAVAPISILYFGFGSASKIAVVVLMTTSVMLLNAYKGLNAVGPDPLDLVYSYAATPAQTMFKLRLPCSLPFLFTALKYNVTLALVGAIIAEFFGGFGGVGLEMVQALATFSMPKAWAYMILIGIAGVVWFQLVALIERFTTSWHSSFRSQR